jgi:hypothetical protein
MLQDVISQIETLQAAKQGVQAGEMIFKHIIKTSRF